MLTLSTTSTRPPTIIDAARFTVGAVASSQTIDGDRDIVRAAGWQLGRVERGQCKLLNSHASGDIRDILGRIDSARVIGDELHAVISYAVTESPLAEFAWKMTLGGFLSGYSVGFVPLAVATLDDIRDDSGKVTTYANRKLWDLAVADMRLDPAATEAAARRIICAAQLVELSALAVPSNPDAMIKAYNGGAVREEDFAALGLAGAEEWELISKGANAWHSMNGAQRASFSKMLGGIASNYLQTKGNGIATADKAQRSAAEAKTIQERADFLAVCETLAARLAAATKGEAGNQ